jgi:DNA-binding HxlR family transcriptional regulator
VLLRILAFGVLAAIAVAYFRRGATKRRRQLILAALKKRPQATFATLSRALKHPAWLAPALRVLASEGLIEVTHPEDFDPNSPREEQVTYRRNHRPRSF